MAMHHARAAFTAVSDETDSTRKIPHKLQENGNYFWIGTGPVRFLGKSEATVDGIGTFSVLEFQALSSERHTALQLPEKRMAKVIRELASELMVERVLAVLQNGSDIKLPPQISKRAARLEALITSENVLNHAEFVSLTFGRSDGPKNVKAFLPSTVLEALATEYAIVKDLAVKETIALFTDATLAGIENQKSRQQERRARPAELSQN